MATVNNELTTTEILNGKNIRFKWWVFRTVCYIYTTDPGSWFSDEMWVMRWQTRGETYTWFLHWRGFIWRSWLFVFRRPCITSETNKQFWYKAEEVPHSVDNWIGKVKDKKCWTKMFHRMRGHARIQKVLSERVQLYNSDNTFLGREDQCH